MENIAFSKIIKCGNSKRKVQDIILTIVDIEFLRENNWSYRVIVTGENAVDKTLDARSAFECLTLGMAFLRQSLRQLKEESPKLKFYDDVEGKLEEITIEDVFWTHDCIPENIEEMMEWAIDNGYEADC